MGAMVRAMVGIGKLIGSGRKGREGKGKGGRECKTLLETCYRHGHWQQLSVAYQGGGRTPSIGVEIFLLLLDCSLHHFYRAMHFSAKRGIAIACRPSV